MIRVAFVTQWNEIEGAAEYAKNLVDMVHKQEPDIQITPFKAPFDVQQLLEAVADFDVVHFNFCFGPHGNLTSPGTISRFGSKRVVLTFHESNPQDNANTHAFLKECARVVSHERNNHGFIFIPQGIPVMDNSKWSPSCTTVGTAGFPFPDKRVPEIAQAARILIESTKRIDGCTIVACESGHADTWSVRQSVMNSVPNAKYLTTFVSQDELLDAISTNLVNIFAPNSRRLGPSGSVRLGLATGSHIVLSRSLMFRDLYEYEDEIEWIEGTSEDVTPQKIAAACLRVIDNGKRPKKILEDGSWSKCANLYADVYRSI